MYKIKNLKLTAYGLQLVLSFTLVFAEHEPVESSHSPQNPAESKKEETTPHVTPSVESHSNEMPPYKILSKLLMDQIDQQPWDLTRVLIDRLLVEAPPESPELARVLLKAARFAASHDRSGEAIIYYEHWYSISDDTPEASEVMIELGRQCRNIGAIKHALDSFYRAGRALRRVETGPNPTIRTAQWEVAETSYQLRDWERARQLFANFTNSPQTIDILTQSAFYRMADCSRALGDQRQMGVDYTRALAHNPKHSFAPDARMALIDIFLDQENYDQVLENVGELSALISKMPSHDSLYWKRRSGEVLFRHMFQLHSNDISIKILEAMAKMDPSESWQSQIAEWKALVYLEKTQWENALQCFSKSAQLAQTASSSDSKTQPTITALDPELLSRYTEICKWVLSFKNKEVELQLPPLP